MYEKIITGFGKIYTSAGAKVFLYAAAGFLGLLLIFNLVYTVVLCIKKNNMCACRVIQLNGIRRRVLFIFSYLVVFAALPALVPLGPAGGILVADIMLVAAFLVVIHLLDLVFTLVCKTKKCCCECKNCKKEEEKIEKIEKIEEVKVEKPEKIEEPEPAIEPAPKPAPKSAVRKTPAQVAAEQGATIVPKRVIERSTIVSGEPRLAPKPRPAAPRAAAKPAPVVRKTVEEIAAERRNERIEELGAKIERQRNRAEKTTDAMQIEDEAYTQRTREGLATAADTASRMDELQRRMDMLRQKAPLPPTERVVREEVVREQRRDEVVRREESDIRDYRTQQSSAQSMRVTGGVVSRQTTIEEMKREREGLRRQYEMLQNKLLQMKSEQRESASVGFNTSPGNFERTGKTEALAKIPTRNKFDEEEVNAALLGLKKAMDDLQRQIDARDE
jgi:hypothetical protein